MKRFMINLILYLWQLPQNIIGLIIIFFTRAKIGTGFYNQCYISENYRFGVSLGNYIIFGGLPYHLDIMHEQGHQKQSLYLGWLYLLIIGLPSLCGNIYDRLFHKKLDIKERYFWYYNQPWEKWADKLGGVKR